MFNTIYYRNSQPLMQAIESSNFGMTIDEWRESKRKPVSVHYVEMYHKDMT